MNLSDIFCQERSVEALRQAFGCGRVGHAYIFAGANGIGRFATAGVWTKLLLCESPTSENELYDSCGKCQSCIAFEAGAHPDFNHVYKELVQFTKNPANRKKIPIDLPIDVIREFVIDKVFQRPSLSQTKVYVISEAEKLNASSQNALLKVLEEPPSFCFIILLCTRLEALLPTTQSRCQIIRFGPISQERIVEKLSGDVPEAEARYWGRFTEGSLGGAISFSQLADEKTSFYEFKKSLVEKLARFELAQAVDFAQWIIAGVKTTSDIWAKKNPNVNTSDIKRQTQKAVISMIISAFADAMKAGFVSAEDFINFDQAQQIMVLAERFGAEGASEQISKCYEAISWIEASVNEKLIFEHLLLNFVSSATIAG
ncbi:MAG: hypothetical protein K8R02_00605 [Anaerohalosphaeraceae bacterium]|nr:hypothetical protein [Anaerohalosphaeraceae bacterium]